MSHRPNHRCDELGLASAPACPPRNLADVTAYLAGRIEDARRERNNLDSEDLQAMTGLHRNRALGSFAGRLDALVEVFDWVRTGEAIEAEHHTAITALVTEVLAGSVTGEAAGFTHVFIGADEADTPAATGKHRPDCDANRALYGHRLACRCKHGLPPLSEAELRSLWGDR